MEAAARVELMLPETGVCNAGLRRARRDDRCRLVVLRRPGPAEAAACCAEDANAKAAGASGCGCP